MVEIFVHEHVDDGLVAIDAVVVFVGVAAAEPPSFEMSSPLLLFNVLEFRRNFVEFVGCSDVGDATLSSLSAIIPRAIGIAPQISHK